MILIEQFMFHGSLKVDYIHIKKKKPLNTTELRKMIWLPSKDWRSEKYIWTSSFQRSFHLHKPHLHNLPKIAGSCLIPIKPYRHIVPI